jgi:hypothetical protein
MTYELTPDEYQRMLDERIIAKRITLDQYSEHCAGKTEYLNGRIMVGGTELFVGVKEFAESIRVLDEEKENAQGAGQ